MSALPPSPAPIVHVVRGQQHAKGVGQVDFIADPIEGSVIIVDTPDRDAFIERCVEAGRQYERGSIVMAAKLKADPNVSSIPWPPPKAAPLIPQVPIQGQAQSRSQF